MRVKGYYQSIVEHQSQGWTNSPGPWLILGGIRPDMVGTLEEALCWVASFGMSGRIYTLSSKDQKKEIRL